MSIHNENHYEDLLGLWSDLESGLGVILGSPGSIQEFEKRVWQYDRWMKDLLKRDADVGLYLLFQLASNSPVGYSASHSLVSAVLSHLIAQELHLPYQERDSLVHAALTMNIAMTALQDELATQSERPSGAQLDAIRLHAMKGSLMLANLGVVDELWLETITSHHDELTDAGDLYQIQPGQRLAECCQVIIQRLVDAGRVLGVEAGHGLQQQGAVMGVTCHRAALVEARCKGDETESRNAAVRRLHANDSSEGSRLANRASGVRSE